MPTKNIPEAKSTQRSAPAASRHLSKAANPPTPKRTKSANGNGHGSQAKEKLAEKDDDKKTKKSKKIKLTSSIPETEYAALLKLREKCSDLGIHVKKSELIRAGFQLSNNLSIRRVKTELSKIVDLNVAKPKTKK
jgi:hypothetical protein